VQQLAARLGMSAERVEEIELGDFDSDDLDRYAAALGRADSHDDSVADNPAPDGE